MALFTFYFAICLFGLLVRGYYRIPETCIIHETLDKDEGTVKSLIADRMECRCHYTNFLRYKTFFDEYNQTIRNHTFDDSDEKQKFEPMALVRFYSK